MRKTNGESMENAAVVAVQAKDNRRNKVTGETFCTPPAAAVAAASALLCSFCFVEAVSACISHFTLCQSQLASLVI